MATVAAQVLQTARDGPLQLVWWNGLTANDVGARFFVGHRPGKSVQLLGTFGGAVTLRGSNKNNPDVTVATDWVTLTDPLGNLLSFTAAGLKEVLEAVLWVSPAAAALVTAVDVYLLNTSARTRA